MVVLSGCGREEPDSAGPDPNALDQPIAVDEWCTPTPAPPLRELARGILGLCGHFLAGGGASELLLPDGTSTTVPGPVWNPRFSPTGNLAAWTLAEDGDVLVLFDVRSGEFRQISGNVGYYSFMRSAIPGLGAWLYSQGADGPRFFTLDHEWEPIGFSPYNSDRWTLGSPRLVFATEAGDIMIADADVQEIWKVGSGFNFYDEFEWLDIDHRGGVVLHHAYGGTDHEQIATHVYAADGDLLASFESGATLLQTHRAGAPPFLIASGDLWLVHYQAGVPELTQLTDRSVTTTSLATDGSLLASSYGEVILAPAATPEQPMSLGEYEKVLSLGLAPSARAAAWFGWRTDLCATDSCSRYVSELHRWTADEGLQAPIMSVLMSDRVAAVFDSGVALVFAAPIPGVVPDAELPEHRWMLIDLDGQILAEFEGDCSMFGDRFVPLPDGRLLTTVDDGITRPALHVLDPTAGTLEQYGPEPRSIAVLDGFGERVALGGVNDTTFWGALP
ncbi:MAG TPA: hypothetical protein VK034_09960 [Enhygromyxa sp.]|nr:hypothetical protein [Enhygromyxa sp.]